MSTYKNAILIGILIVVILFVLLTIVRKNQTENKQGGKETLKQKIIKTLSLLLMIAGVAIFLYPDVATLLQDRNSEKYIEDFEEIYKTDDQKDGDGEEEQERPFQDLYDAIVAYNENIYETGQKDFKDAWCYTQSPVIIDCLENELFGYIEVPSMDVKLPLYIGASEYNMARGRHSHGQTSIPIGGINTNSVIAGHRGYAGAPFFRYIENVKLGTLSISPTRGRHDVPGGGDFHHQPV